MSAQPTEETKEHLNSAEMLLLWIVILLWVAMFIIGTLVDSQPYREDFAALDGGVGRMISTGLLVVLVYTLTNVGILSILAGVLGTLGAKAILGSDVQGKDDSMHDTTSPLSSAVLRSFLVYLALLAGVLIFRENPINPSQQHYVKLAGTLSLVAFIVSYRPTIFGQLLMHAGRLVSDSRPQPGSPAHQ